MLKVGIVGCGRQGWRRAKPITESGDRLVVVADSDYTRASQLAKETCSDATTSWQDVVTRHDLDAVVICTPNDSHASISLAAMKSGKHVLCEKPLARTPEEAETIVQTAKKTGIKVKCGFTLRHHPGIRQARKWFEEGKLGKLNFLRIRYGICGRIGYDHEWRSVRKLAGGGQLMDQGIHALDLSRWFLGEFAEVFGFVTNYYWKNADVEDNAFCLLRTKDGEVASIHASWTQWRNLFCFEIFGQEGYSIVEGLGGSYGTETAKLGKRQFDKPFTEDVLEFKGEAEAWLEEWHEFTEAIAENREPLGNGDDGLQAIKLAYAVYQASASGQSVKLPV